MTRMGRAGGLCLLGGLDGLGELGAHMRAHALSLINLHIYALACMRIDANAHPMFIHAPMNLHAMPMPCS